MKMSLLKFRYVLLGLLAFHLIFAFIGQVYTSALFRSDKFDILLMLLSFLVVALIAFKRKWADIVSFTMFAIYIVGVAKSLASFCQDRNVSTLKICVNTIAVYMSEVWSWVYL